MKSVILVASLLFVSTNLAMAAANPASVYCEKLGGKSQIVKIADGSEIGLCTLANGSTFEEWTLFRMLNDNK